ncbi:cystatin-like fold lipoprotein [Fictibacillus enclensis]|uniref:cystatin-like fold lipoprotein n=1 Tax=Fictibacillus enclensis TaxID=1017270 RepID=UPI0025A27AC9|nr:cystatin-like fold lipoprotein [Fictibacillus enclensis]MDM5197037.1 cystatin-like fold lipoprotein [Fictibacillus enclensis]
MKRIFIFLNLIIIVVLSACGGNKYDEAIDNVINLEKKDREKDGLDAKEITRDNAIIRVYSGGKYIQVAYNIDETDSKLYYYYEKLGDSYQEMSKMPGSGEDDRLGLDKKTPDYEEIRGEQVD